MKNSPSSDESKTVQIQCVSFSSYPNPSQLILLLITIRPRILLLLTNPNNQKPVTIKQKPNTHNGEAKKFHDRNLQKKQKYRSTTLSKIYHKLSTSSNHHNHKPIHNPVINPAKSQDHYHRTTNVTHNKPNISIQIKTAKHLQPIPQTSL